jgi:hypothetical protein
VYLLLDMVPWGSATPTRSFNLYIADDCMEAPAGPPSFVGAVPPAAASAPLSVETASALIDEPSVLPASRCATFQSVPQASSDGMIASPSVIGGGIHMRSEIAAPSQPVNDRTTHTGVTWMDFEAVHLGQKTEPFSCRRDGPSEARR